jgi:predicted NUDIX family phosphoesterase
VTSRNELILGLPRERIIARDGWRGVRPTDLAPYLAAIAKNGEYRPRHEAEVDETWKQVIPYLALRDRGRLFLMRRTRAGTDSRLHDRWSIGVGGHVHPDDVDPVAGLLREWREELDADWLPEPIPLGLLNDDSTPVGRVHLGLVFVAEADGRRVAIRETDKLSGSFVDPAAVLPVYQHLETWSQLLYDHLEGRPSALVR